MDWPMMAKMVERRIVGQWFGFRFEFMSVVESRSMLTGICTKCSVKERN